MLVEDKLVNFLKRYHDEERVRKVARFVNEHFPDATGFLVPDAPSSVFFFKSEGSAYYAYPAKGTIHYSRKYSEVLNPKFCFNSWTKEVDFSRPMKSKYLCYRKPKSKKQQVDDWKKKAKADKKARQENVDELLAATRDTSGRTFDNSRADSPRRDNTSSNSPYDLTPPKQPEEPKPVKIETLDDVKKVNNERKKKPKKPKKRKKKRKKHDATKGMW